MPFITPLPSLLRASATDAGNASMRAGGRSAWNRKDYNAAVDTLNRLTEASYGTGPKGCIAFQDATAAERAGLLRLGMSPEEIMEVVARM